jgi:hypothetical protein
MATHFVQLSSKASTLIQSHHHHSTSNSSNVVPVPLHVYQLGLHMFHNYKHPHALTFYVRV